MTQTTKSKKISQISLACELPKLKRCFDTKGPQNSIYYLVSALTWTALVSTEVRSRQKKKKKVEEVGTTLLHTEAKKFQEEKNLCYYS